MSACQLASCYSKNVKQNFYASAHKCTKTCEPACSTLSTMSSIEPYKDEQAREWEDQFQEREQTLDEPLTCCRWGKMAVGRGLIYPFIKRSLNWWATGKELHPWFGELAMLTVNRLSEELEEKSIIPINLSFQRITATLVVKSIKPIIWIWAGGLLRRNGPIWKGNHWNLFWSTLICCFF